MGSWSRDIMRGISAGRKYAKGVKRQQTAIIRAEQREQRRIQRLLERQQKEYEVEEETKENIEKIGSKNEEKENLIALMVSVLIVVVSLVIVFGLSENDQVEEKSNKIKKTESSSADSLIKEELIRNIQKHLIALGIDAGLADGIYGPRTESAIRRFQESHDLAVNGKVSESLLKHLSEALNSKSKLGFKKEPNSAP